MKGVCRTDKFRSLESVRRMAQKHLKKITLLQNRINVEEKDLRVLLKNYGSEVL